MKDKVIFATGNAGKMKEVRLILADLGKEILSMDEAGFKGDIEKMERHLRKMRRLRRGLSGNRREEPFLRMTQVLS